MIEAKTYGDKRSNINEIFMIAMFDLMVDGMSAYHREVASDIWEGYAKAINKLVDEEGKKLT